jgi:hypothetical protein
MLVYLREYEAKDLMSEVIIPTDLINRLNYEQMIKDLQSRRIERLNLYCQAFFATALSSSGTCWIARFTVEGKFFNAGSIAPIVMAPALNTQNASIATWTLLQANGAAYAQIRARSNAADADNTQTLAGTQAACNARNQSTGVVASSQYYAAPSEFYSSWRDTTGAQGGAGN